MIRYFFIAALYIAGGLQAGSHYYEKAQQNCFDRLYWRAMTMTVVWPIWGWVPADKFQNFCKGEVK